MDCGQVRVANSGSFPCWSTISSKFLFSDQLRHSVTGSTTHLPKSPFRTRTTSHAEQANGSLHRWSFVHRQNHTLRGHRIAVVFEVARLYKRSSKRCHEKNRILKEYRRPASNAKINSSGADRGRQKRTQRYSNTRRHPSERQISRRSHRLRIAEKCKWR